MSSNGNDGQAHGGAVERDLERIPTMTKTRVEASTTHPLTPVNPHQTGRTGPVDNDSDNEDTACLEGCHHIQPSPLAIQLTGSTPPVL